MQLPRSLIGPVVALALASAPLPVHASAFAFAAPGDTTPETAQEARVPVQNQARGMAAGDPAVAANYLGEQGRELKDPVLLLDAAAAYRDAGEASRDRTMVEQGMAQLRLADDMLYFLNTTAGSEVWQPLNSSDISGAMSRSRDLMSQCETLLADIDGEGSLVEEPVEEEPEKRPGNGKGLLIGGAVALGLGAAGLGLGIGGLVMGNDAQGKVQDPLILDPDEHAAAEDRGRTGNALAYAGFIIGGVGIGAGIALIILGLKKKKNAGVESETARAVIVPSFNGIAVSGRF